MTPLSAIKPHCPAVVSLLCCLLAGAGSSDAADSPNYSLDETIVEYDVDPSWPQRPDHVQPFGAVAGMALDDKEQVWLCCRGKDSVQVYKTDGTFVRTWGKGSFDKPHQLRIDPAGNIWVADFALHVVQKFTPEGQLLLMLGTRGQKGEDATHFNMPTDMAVTKQGDVFITDGYANRRVVHFDRDGKFVKAWGGYGSKPGQFVLPHSIVVDSKGRLLVADRNSARIQVFDQSGQVLDVWSNLLMPWGLSITAEDQLWVCGSSPHWWFRGSKDPKYPEFRDQMFMRFSAEGRVQQIWTIPLGEKGKVKPGDTIGAHCIVPDSKGNLYVGDIYGERAQKFVPISKRPKDEK